MTADLALVAKDFLKNNKDETDTEQNDHKAIPPTGMLSVDGTKVSIRCAVYLHRFMPRSHYVDNRRICQHLEPADRRLQASRIH